MNHALSLAFVGAGVFAVLYPLVFWGSHPRCDWKEFLQFFCTGAVIVFLVLLWVVSKASV